MTYVLHNRLGSGGFAIQATLVAAGVGFDYVPIASTPNQALGPAVQHLNRWGQVPVLELSDRTRITEVAAILAHLSYAEAAIKDGPTLFIDDHPSFLRWLVFLAVNIYEGILRKSYTDRYIACEADLAASAVPEEVRAWAQEGVRRAAKARIHDALLCLEAETAAHRFLLSDRMSPCDIFLAMLYAWHNQKPDLPKCTWITTQVATHPKIRPLWKQNFETRLDFKWHEL